MSKIAKFVGLDVHKDTISIAVCEGGALDEPADLGQIAHDVSRLLKRLERLGEPGCLHVAYEAGPTGFALARALREQGIDCVVVAPSKTPVLPGDRVKTDKRDAAKLARYLRMGQLVAIDLPGTEQEALRDLVRARQDAVRARHRARQQLKSFLLRHGRSFEGKSSWTHRHHDWIRGQRFESEAQRAVLEDYWNEVVHAGERVLHLTSLVESCAQMPAFAKLYHALQALRGISTVIAATLVAELGSFLRFATPAKLMSYVGVTPSERSSGQRTKRGSITKAGNSSVRHVLIEAAWCQRLRPAMSDRMKKRNEGLPLEIQEIAWKAQKRLHKRFVRMSARGKSTQCTVVAVARELAGFVWAIGRQVA
jgi:transposase